MLNLSYFDDKRYFGGFSFLCLKKFSGSPWTGMFHVNEFVINLSNHTERLIKGKAFYLLC